MSISKIILNSYIRPKTPSGLAGILSKINQQPKFSTDVLPLIQSRCATANCHDASASGGIILQNYTQVFTVKDRIKTRAVVQKTMPVFTPLNAAETATLKCWIDNGAINN